MSKPFQEEVGFTLIEMLIVIIILGILAAIIIPQLTVSTEDAKVSTLKTNLAGLRSSIEIYYAQHHEKYPGQTKSADGTTNNDALEAATSMVKQLTQYTNSAGQIQATKNTTFKYGPYVKGPSLPANPFNDGTGVVCDNSADITAARAPTATAGIGWKFHFNTGILYADDNAAHAAY